MTKSNIRIITFFITILLFFVFTNIVNADELDLDNYKIIAIYKIENEIYSKKKINIYKIAEINEKKDFVLLQEFKEHNLTLADINSSTDLDNLANIILGIINNDKIEAYGSNYTNENGTVVFEDLELGVYLLESEDLQEKDKTITYAPAIVVIPDSNDNYEVEVEPKGSITKPTYEEKEYKLVIYWDDEGKSRPTSVQVNIFKDGIKQESVTLSSKNNWSYVWNTLDDNSEWTVLETGLPSGYTMRQEKENNSFYITNIYKEPTNPGGDPTPPTGNNPVNPENPSNPVNPSKPTNNTNKLPNSLEELNAILREKTKNKVKLPVTGEEKTVFIFLIIAIVSIIGLIVTNIVSKRLEKDK